LQVYNAIFYILIDCGLLWKTCKQDGKLSPRDCATFGASLNLVSCCAAAVV